VVNLDSLSCRNYYCYRKYKT